MAEIIVVVLAVAFLAWAYSLSAIPELIHSRWQHYFPELQFSTQDFYKQVEETLKSRKIPDTSFSRESFSQKGFLSKKRKYLRVKSGPYNFDICAAPYGIGFFTSWWFGEDRGCLMRLLEPVPFLGAFMRARASKKSYYQWDTEAMFREAVHAAVIEAIDSMTDAHGLRQMSEAERRITTVRI